jgi:hypothetical protein
VVARWRHRLSHGRAAVGNGWEVVEREGAAGALPRPWAGARVGMEGRWGKEKVRHRQTWSQGGAA